MDRFNKAFNGGCCPKPKEDKEAEKAAEKAAEAANDAADAGSVSVDAGIPAPAGDSGNSTNFSDNSTNSSGIAAGDAGDAGASAGDAGASGGEGGGAMGESLNEDIEKVAYQQVRAYETKDNFDSRSYDLCEIDDDGTYFDKLVNSGNYYAVVLGNFSCEYGDDGNDNYQ
jgi:hypothetical protein